MNDEETENIQRLPEVGQAARRPYLLVVAGADLARRYPVTPPAMTIGRSEASQVVLAERNVSRCHARIVSDGAAVILEDLGSTNGTYVNGESVTTRVLEEGDLIGIGESVLRFCYQSAVESAFYDEIYQSVRLDDLTGLLNRRFFLRRLHSEFSRSQRYDRALSLLLIDLDDFKQINDTHGHPAGDALLSALGRVIGACLRRSIDCAARYGGEEFAVLLPETAGARARLVGEKIRRVIERLQIRHGGTVLGVTVSLGLAARGEGIATAEELVQKADQRLYAAKHKGKNRVES
ncbi:MAG: GGDEF domain-containing protein [Pseudomonadota bacterium]|nr:GGDEF domain-containing protein [Pseudomonadota bacterium]